MTLLFLLLVSIFQINFIVTQAISSSNRDVLCSLGWDAYQLPCGTGSLNVIFDGVDISNSTGNVQGIRYPRKYSQLTGTIPNAFSLLTDLTYLDLSYQKLSGTIPDAFNRLTFLQILILKKNQLSGSIPCPASLSKLDLAGNGFADISQLTSDCTQIVSLDLSQNSLTGTFPTFDGFSLQNLGLAGNKLTGDIPFLGNALRVLNCSNNRLTGFGRLPLSTNLKELNVAWNQISGTIPSEFVNIDQCDWQLSSNLLSGTIPSLRLHRILDLSNNQLTGSVPYFPSTDDCSCDGRILRLRSNQLSSITLTSFPLNMKIIELNNNRLSGTIPSTFVDNILYPSLQNVNLAFNEFSGQLPVNIGQNISLLDLSWNQFTGPIQLNVPVVSSERTLNILGNRLDLNQLVLNEEPQLFDDFSLGPQDIDECMLGLYTCPTNSNCTDGYSPRGSYTCTCYPGYQPSPLTASIPTSCLDINECASGFCNGLACINTEGSYRCCQLGEEVIDGACSNCNFSIKLGDHSPPSEFTTLNPSTLKLNGFTTQTITDIINQLDITACDAPCTGGAVVLSTESPLCPTPPGLSCVYPCVDAAGAITGTGAADYLQREFERIGQREGLLNQTLRLFFGVSVLPFSRLFQLEYRTTLASYLKRNNFFYDRNYFFMDFEPCNNVTVTNMPNIQVLVKGLSRDIIPAMENLTEVVIENNCTLKLTFQDEIYIFPYVRMVIICVAIGLAVAGLFGLAWWWKHSSILGNLPEEVAWSYRLYEQQKSQWSKRGVGDTVYYVKDLVDGEYLKVLSFLKSQMIQQDSGDDGLEIDKIEAVYPKHLVSNFVNMKRVMEERSKVSIFQTSEWRSAPDASLKEWVHNKYLEKCHSYPWNKELLTPIIPVVHGTSVTVAESIASTGFATLSSKDEGWYGQGIYMTSYPLYTIPYMSKTQPALVFSWILPGNAYPVTEDPKQSGSLIGKPTRAGHNSHYVITTTSGRPPHRPITTGNIPLFDEIIVNQEAQISPAFIIHVNPRNIKKLLKLQSQIASRELGSYRSANSQAALAVNMSNDFPKVELNSDEEISYVALSETS